MSRSVSSTLKAAVYGQETSEVFLVILEIDHDDLASPIRVVNNYENITSNGDTYTGYPFEINLPDDTEEGPGDVELRIDNVDRAIVQAVRDISGAATAELSVVLASDPDTIEVGPYSMTVREASYTSLVVTGTLTVEDILNEPYPGDLITPQNFPGMF